MGTMSFSLRNRLTRHIERAQKSQDEVTRAALIKEVLYLSIISPEFQTFEHEVVNWNIWKKESKELIELMEAGGDV